MRECKSNGYIINLTYVWLKSPELAISRVAKRVASGGHDIPRDTIARRYQRGRNNFLNLYSPLADSWIIYNNSESSIQIVAEKTIDGSSKIYQPIVWQQINSQSL